MFHCNFTMRLDEATEELLNDLVLTNHISKSALIRKSLRLLKNFSELQKKHGDVKLVTSTEKEVLILTS